MIVQYPTSSALLDYADHKPVSNSGKPVEDIVVAGSGITQCFSRAQSKIAKDLYLGQIQLVDLSTHMTPPTLLRALVSLNRIGTMDLTPFIFVSGSPLPDVMDTPGNGAQFPTLYYVTQETCVDCQPVNLSIHLWQFSSDALTPGVDPHLPYVTVEPNKNVTVNRIALYRHLQFIVALNPQQTADYGLLKGLAQKLTLAVPYDHATVRDIHGYSRLSTHLKGGQIQARFHIVLQGTLANLRSITDTTTDNAIIARESSEILSRQCLAVLTFTQQHDIDPWGIGRMLNWQHPDAFARYPHWHHEYPRVEMVVHVQMQLHKLGDLK